MYRRYDMIKYIYSVFLGLLLAIFVGVGISVFYQQPAQPQYPTELTTIQKEPTTEQQEVEKKYQLQQQAWDEQMKPYNRNVSLIALVAAVILVGISLAMGERAKVMADGIMLGGVFTLVYSLIRSFASTNTRYSFIVVTVALITVLVLGYVKIIRPHDQRSKKLA